MTGPTPRSSHSSSNARSTCRATRGSAITASTSCPASKTRAPRYDDAAL